MDSENQLKSYLAHWFQLGKRVLINNGQEGILPQPLFENGQYSKEFEQCWQLIVSEKSGDCYLEGTNQTIAELLTPAWEVVPCSRCEMPLVLRRSGLPPSECPCNDLLTWPNTELPKPRSPIDSQSYLNRIHSNLVTKSSPSPSENSN